MRINTLLIAVLLTSFASASKVIVTAYNPSIYQTDSSSTITATGQHVRRGIIAVSPNLLRRYPFHSHVRLICGKFKHKYRVEDITSSRFINRVDIFTWSHRNAIKWGVKRCQMKRL